MSVVSFVAHSTRIGFGKGFSTTRGKCQVSRSLRCRPRRDARLPVREAPSATVSLAASSWGVWATLVGAAVGGLAANRTKLGAAMSPPVVTTIATMFLTNVGVLPASHVAYGIATKILVPLAIPCLLFNANLFRVMRDTGRLLPAFIIGAFATVVSIIAAYHFVPLAPTLGVAEGWKVAAALCARHIGGAVNFVSAADSLKISASGVTTTLAADTVVLSGYFILLFFLARGVNDPALDRANAASVAGHTSTGVGVKSENFVGAENPQGGGHTSNISTHAVVNNQHDGKAEDSESSAERTKITVEEIGAALTISAALCAIGTWMSSYLPAALGVIPTITLISLALSTTVPGVFGRFARAGNSVGLLFMQMFFAACGASGSIVSVVRTAPVLFLFVIVHLMIHLCIVMGVGAVTRMHRAELLVASNANVGGPTTALAMATAKEWKSLMIPSLLIGVFGYSVATFIGLGVGHVFLKG